MSVTSSTTRASVVTASDSNLMSGPSASKLKKSIFLLVCIYSHQISVFSSCAGTVRVLHLIVSSKLHLLVYLSGVHFNVVHLLFGTLISTD